MTQTVVLMTDAELTRCPPAGDEDGFGALATARGRLPLTALDMQARLEGLSAEVTVCQTFVNSLTEPLEASYIFPLPDRAAVTRFRFEVAGRVIEGVLKERGEARREYDEAIQTGHRAAITEEERPGVFTMRVGNLMPGEHATVRLTLVGPLPFSDGEATFRFPLVVAPRYIPGVPLAGQCVGDGVAHDSDAVPDASRISPPVLLPGFPNPVRLSLGVEIHSLGLSVTALRSSLHAVSASEDGDGIHKITIQPGERLNRDFILRFKLGADAVQTSLALKPEADGTGTFALTLVPPAGAAHRVRPRDVLFVLDRSGSMSGWKMVAARRALARMVDTLTDRDRFNVLAFDNSIETPPEFGGSALQPATDRNRFRAVEFLAKINARGGTEMAQPLDLAVRELTAQDNERDRIVVLVTDGQVGHEDQILRHIGDRIRNLRVFTLGIDRAVNEGFLKRLAGLGGGCCELVESEDRLDEVMDKVHRRMHSPVLTGLRLQPVGIRLEPGTIVPARLPDLFAGVPLVIWGRYQGSATGSIALQARDAAGQPWTTTVPASVSNSSALPCAWARGHLRDLEDRYAIQPSPALAQQITATSLRFGVLCRFTAFVAVDRSEVVNKGGAQQRVLQPVEPAAGWDMLGTGQSDLLGMGVQGASVFRAAVAGSVDSYLMEAPDQDADEENPRVKTRSGRERATNPPPSMGKRGGSAPGKEGGLFGWLRKSKKGVKGGSVPERLGLDLSAYRPRARGLLDTLLATPTTAGNVRIAALGQLGVRLAELVEDLRSVGVPAGVIEPLERLNVTLRSLLATTNPAAAEVDRVWNLTVQILRDFADGAEPTAPARQSRRGEFWK